ncbi:spindlin interactor and repressor of chromatin-binding protein-like [Rhinatrema bivittatum]|uniref:spindlin interactor and repressor of chromatin-binding protein-like n=1 Tax=Rhinatrema bivittatum TaxID=194408 RepID=UPI0011277CBF|nr:spindlin interactor and repressor of chromatin-binding protein-like [Rhinatrema bivittatum]
MMDVKVEQVLEWASTTLKQEEEEVPIETWCLPLLPTTQPIMQESASVETMETGAAACPKAQESILKTEAAWEVSEQKLEVFPIVLIPQGSWAWKQHNGGQELMCRMCGEVVEACTLGGVREHVLQCHSRVLSFSVEQKRCCLDASIEDLVLPKETEDKSLLCFSNSHGTSCDAGCAHDDSAPAEIEVSIDPEEQPVNSKRTQAKGRAPQRPGTKEKSKKVPVKSPRQTGLTVAKDKGKRNLSPSSAQKYRHCQGSGNPSQGIKYVPINLAPAEIRVFTDGSFPKGFIFRLYSRGKAEPSKNQKRKGLSVRVKRPAEKTRKLGRIVCGRHPSETASVSPPVPRLHPCALRSRSQMTPVGPSRASTEATIYSDHMEVTNELGPCSIGIYDGSECHKPSGFYFGRSGLKSIKNFSSEDQELIKRRSGLFSLSVESSICSYHEALILTKFVFLQKYCCNPFKKQNHRNIKGLRSIDCATADHLKAITKKDFKPGQKLCPRCRQDLNVKLQEPEGPQTDSGNDDPYQCC